MRKDSRPGLYANIHAKRKRIAAGSGETMRKVGTAGAPTASSFRTAKKTVKSKYDKQRVIYERCKAFQTGWYVAHRQFSQDV